MKLIEIKPRKPTAARKPQKPIKLKVIIDTKPEKADGN